ncbi:hypothetical protein E3E36_01540 [Thermococcus sp. M36]|uniref:hypothetical protein n=1 Tax=Thermococcus sp. M36 TaxID=1638261 RepID=UPI0014388F8F|nr:hypothetical protein [Thermococcus sp. M36]NJE04854.1 hypothetical protein [Thermococcus sp. M36]
MQIVEVDIKLPYDGRGKVLGRLYEKVRGRVRKAHLFPPTVYGVSELKLVLAVDDVRKFISDLKRVIKNGRVTFKVISEA